MDLRSPATDIDPSVVTESGRATFISTEFRLTTLCQHTLQLVSLCSVVTVWTQVPLTGFCSGASEAESLSSVYVTNRITLCRFTQVPRRLCVYIPIRPPALKLLQSSQQRRWRRWRWGRSRRSNERTPETAEQTELSDGRDGLMRPAGDNEPQHHKTGLIRSWLIRSGLSLSESVSDSGGRLSWTRVSVRLTCSSNRNSNISFNPSSVVFRSAEL